MCWGILRDIMRYVCLLVFLCVVTTTVSGEYSARVDVETGWLWVGRADVRIPGDEGTRFSFTGDLDADDTAYFRGRISWRPAPRHFLAVTAAPLEAEASGTLRRETLFVDTVFPADERVKANFQFNNYRLTYRYRLRETERLAFDLGGTLFVRDARVVLESDERRDSDYDLGLVPLLSFGVSWNIQPRTSVVLDGDALAAPQGRAFDVLLALEHHLREHLQLGAGYRILEGGADNDDVYTFAMFHHAAVYMGWLF